MTITPRDTLVVAGHSVVLTYDDAGREYDAIRDSCGALRRDERGRWTFGGAGAAAALNGLLTNDVEVLANGEGCYAAALTVKGRIVADVRVLRRENDFLVDVASRAAAGWAALVKKYVNPRMATVAEVSAAMGCIGAYGPRSVVVLSRLTGLEAHALSAMVPYAHVAATINGAPVRLLRSPDFGVVGFDVFVDTPKAEAVFDALIAGGARPVGLAAADIARVEAGRPEWGIDMDEATLPQEANLEALHAISYTKGCYTGQEVVARVHFRGHVNRHLRGLVADEPLAPHATVVSTERADVGDVRSSVVSPRFGPIALAMLRREISPGDDVIVRAADHELPARVQTPPF